MRKGELLFQEIAESLPTVTTGKMFGALAVKASNGKAILMYWKNDMIFKLDEKSIQAALDLSGSKFFDPMGGRPMKEWVQVPSKHSDKWKGLAKKALAFQTGK